MLLLVVRMIGSFKLFCLIAFPLCKILCLEDTVSQINQVCRCVCVCTRETTGEGENLLNWIHYVHILLHIYLHFL